MKAILLCAVLALGLQAQSVHFGVKGGMPLNDAIDAAGSFKSDFKHFTFGPMVDVFLPGGLGVEANALYKKTGSDDCCCFSKYLRSNGFEARQCVSPLLPFLPDVYFSGN